MLNATERNLATSLLDLPPELVLEIGLLVSASSQQYYHTLLLLSKKCYRLLRLRCLPAVPVVLTDNIKARSFHNLTREHGEWIRHLWAVDGRSPAIRLLAYIIGNCPNLISLACTQGVLRDALDNRFRASVDPGRDKDTTPSGEFLSQLEELWLIESPHRWGMWAGHPLRDKVERVFGGLKRLRLAAGLTPDFPTEWFTRLEGLAFESRPIEPFVMRHLRMVGGLLSPGSTPVAEGAPAPWAGEERDEKKAKLASGRLNQVVILSYWWKNQVPEEEIEKVLALDQRLTVLSCGAGWEEREVWRESVLGSESSLWVKDAIVEERVGKRYTRLVLAVH
ncbi:hypothetical protein AX16_005280 [Volvariella volvacea WC 439]|nr:hypothetical protein AX16_005280 [Volvariella volvacea WC 439]